MLDLISRKQKLVEIVIIFCVFLAVTFRFGEPNDGWVWSRVPYIALILICVSLTLAIIWLRAERSRMESEMKTSREASRPVLHTDLLTARQQDVLQLIIEGKSNKEIAAELFIEFSTLKTHINRIYKTLDVSSRKEARTLDKRDNS